MATEAPGSLDITELARRMLRKEGTGQLDILMTIGIILITKSNADTSNSNEQSSREVLNTRAAALRAAYDEQQ